MAKINVERRIVPATSERVATTSSAPAKPRQLMEPKSEHLMKICDANVTQFDTTGKKANGGQGEMITFVFEVIEGEFTGRKIWQRVCIKHTGSLQAEEIGREFMDTLCRSLALVTWPDDTDEFLHKPLIGVIGKHDSYNGEERNQLSYTKPHGKPKAAKAEAADGVTSNGDEDSWG